MESTSMTDRTKLFAVVGLVATVAGIAHAEDVTGADKILCAGVQATYCDTSGDCEIGMPWLWNMPQFIELHLDENRLSTTAAAPRPRQTAIRTLERADGEIYVQGVENGRAFSFVIDEISGIASIAIAADGLTVSVFGSCTPLPGGAGEGVTR
jgi:hypothetical protein